MLGTNTTLSTPVGEMNSSVVSENERWFDTHTLFSVSGANVYICNQWDGSNNWISTHQHGFKRLLVYNFVKPHNLINSTITATVRGDSSIVFDDIAQCSTNTCLKSV